MSTEKFKYDFLRYNRHMVLKPHGLLIAIFLYYLKDLLIVVAIAATAFKARGASSELNAIMALATPKMIFSNFPVLLIVYAWAHRNPNGADFVRTIWRNGRHLILVAAVINSVMIWIQPIPPGNLIFGIFLGLMALNIITVIYIYRAEQVRDVFAEFPQPVEGSDKS